MELDPTTRAHARLALREAARNLYDPNVRMVSLGFPEKDGELIEDELAIRFHVREKYSRIRLESAIAGGATHADLSKPIRVGRYQFQTDVVEGQYRAHIWPWRRPGAPPPPSTDPRIARADPLRGGIGISDEYHYAYGTLGAKVIDRASGAEMILSNWHVLVAEWSAVKGQRIYQPARGDGGDFTDTVAALTRHAMGANLDAAVATLSGSRPLINDQLDLGAVRGVGMAQLGMKVAKSGRRTGVTYGRVTDVEGSALINYGPVDKKIQRVFVIEPLNRLDEVSNAGDSGSLWIDPSTMQAIGLHFAGDNQPERALAMDILPVLDALGVDLATETAPRAARQFALGVRAPAAAAMPASRTEEALVAR